MLHTNVNLGHLKVKSCSTDCNCFTFIAILLMGQKESNLPFINESSEPYVSILWQKNSRKVTPTVLALMKLPLLP